MQDINKIKELTKVVSEIINLPENAEAKKNFEALTNQYSYKSCDTGIGWAAGKDIEFICKLEKGGNEQAIPTIIKGIKNIEEPLYFIYGLNPSKFHFNSAFKLDEKKYLCFIFKLQQNGERKS